MHALPQTGGLRVQPDRHHQHDHLFALAGFRRCHQAGFRGDAELEFDLVPFEMGENIDEVQGVETDRDLASNCTASLPMSSRTMCVDGFAYRATRRVDEMSCSRFTFMILVLSPGITAS
jgi:hypothetical protein